jgi:hypothetical protein
LRILAVTKIIMNITSAIWLQYCRLWPYTKPRQKRQITWVRPSRSSFHKDDEC